MNTTFLGGGFGRRFEMDSVEEALQIAKAAGVPVKVVWTREEDLQHDYYRPGNAALLEGGLDGEGQARRLAPEGRRAAHLRARLPRDDQGRHRPGGHRRAEGAGVRDSRTSRSNTCASTRRCRSASGAPSATPTTPSPWSASSTSWPARPGRTRSRSGSPCSQNHPRAAARHPARRGEGGLGRAAPAGRAHGLAYCHSFDSRVAQVAEVSVGDVSREIVVHRVVCAVDCGVVVNPDTVRAQMMGGCLMGLSAALKEAVEFADGGSRSANFGDYRILRGSEAPPVEVHIVAERREAGRHRGAGRPADRPGRGQRPLRPHRQPAEGSPPAAGGLRGLRRGDAGLRGTGPHAGAGEARRPRAHRRVRGVVAAEGRRQDARAGGREHRRHPRRGVPRGGGAAGLPRRDRGGDRDDDLRRPHRERRGDGLRGAGARSTSSRSCPSRGSSSWGRVTSAGRSRRRRATRAFA